MIAIKKLKVKRALEKSFNSWQDAMMMIFLLIFSSSPTLRGRCAPTTWLAIKHDSECGKASKSCPSKPQSGQNVRATDVSAAVNERASRKRARARGRYSQIQRRAQITSHVEVRSRTEARGCPSRDYKPPKPAKGTHHLWWGWGSSATTLELDQMHKLQRRTAST